MAADEKAETGTTPAPSGGSGGSKLLVILTAVNILATAGMGAVLFISFQRDSRKASLEDIAPNAPVAGAPADAAAGGGKADGKKKAYEFGKMVTLDQFTVNLSTPGSAMPKFVRVNISIEVPSEDVENELTQKMPQVRNAIIDLFNSKRPSDLATAEGRDYLKDEIKNALNGFMITGKVKGVFFTNFALAS